MMKKVALILSCEHAVDTVPEEYRSLFQPYKALLNSHRGIDFGAQAIANHLQKKLSCDLVQAPATRLLIDCNRSLNHLSCFSEITRNLPQEEKRKIINQYYLPFRNQVIDLIEKKIQQKVQVWHISVHSFTPIMNHIIRTTDLGLLYNPQRPSEKALCRQWQKELQQQSPSIKVRLNYPYKGIADGFTTALRKQYNDSDYVGIELESNQKLTSNVQSIGILKNLLSDSLLKLIC